MVLIGGYAPREAVSKLRGISYSRSIMSVCLPGHDEDEGVDAECDQVYQGDGQEQPHWTSNIRYHLKFIRTVLMLCCMHN